MARLGSALEYYAINKGQWKHEAIKATGNILKNTVNHTHLVKVQLVQGCL